MQLHFDPNMLHLQVVVGILEKFEPTAEIEKLHADLEALKAKVVAFRETEVAPILTAIQQKVEEINASQMKKTEEVKTEEKSEAKAEGDTEGKTEE